MNKINLKSMSSICYLIDMLSDAQYVGLMHFQESNPGQLPRKNHSFPFTRISQSPKKKFRNSCQVAMDAAHRMQILNAICNLPDKENCIFLREPPHFDDAVKKLAASKQFQYCLLYTSPSPRDKRQSRMPSSA